MSYREKLLKRISDIPAVYCPEIFSDFVIRGDVKGLEWNMDMLKDEGFPIERFRDLITMIENRIEIKSII